MLSLATNWARGIVASLHLLDLGTRIVIDKALEAKLVITVVSEEKRVNFFSRSLGDAGLVKRASAFAQRGSVAGTC